MSDDVGALDAERVENRDHVRDAVGDRVLLDAFRPLRLAEAAQVGRDHALAGLDERRDLMSPEPRRIGKPVEQEYRGAAALVEHGQSDAVAFEPAQTD